MLGLLREETAGRAPQPGLPALPALTARVGNPLGAAPGWAGGGRGLRGMTERVAVLGGEVSAGPVDGRWEVVVRVPWGSGR